MIFITICLIIGLTGNAYYDDGSYETTGTGNWNDGSYDTTGTGNWNDTNYNQNQPNNHQIILQPQENRTQYNRVEVKKNSGVAHPNLPSDTQR